MLRSEYISFASLPSTSYKPVPAITNNLSPFTLSEVHLVSIPSIFLYIQEIDCNSLTVLFLSSVLGVLTSFRVSTGCSSFISSLITVSLSFCFFLNNLLKIFLFSFRGASVSIASEGFSCIPGVFGSALRLTL